MIAVAMYLAPREFHAVTATSAVVPCLEGWVDGAMYGPECSDLSTVHLPAAYSESWMKPEPPPLKRTMNRQERRKAARGKR